MMTNLLTLAAVLFVITAALHLATPLRYGNTAATRPIVVFGVGYLVLGILIFMGFGWATIPALIVTAIGAIGAITTLNSAPELRTANLLFIAIDAAIIVLLVIRLITG